VHLRATVLRSTAEAPKVTLVTDGKRLEIRHLGFAACGSSIRRGAFAGPKSLDAPEPGPRSVEARWLRVFQLPGLFLGARISSNANSTSISYHVSSHSISGLPAEVGRRA
jgi:hypothetical protein